MEQLQTRAEFCELDMVLGETVAELGENGSGVGRKRWRNWPKQQRNWATR